MRKNDNPQTILTHKMPNEFWWQKNGELNGNTTNDVTSKNFDRNKFVPIPQIYYISSQNHSNATHVYTYQKLHLGLLEL